MIEKSYIHWFFLSYVKYYILERNEEGKQEGGRKGRRRKEIKFEGCVAYQSYENAEQLNNISICHRVEPAHEGVQDGNEGRGNDRCIHIHINDHADGGP